MPIFCKSATSISICGTGDLAGLTYMVTSKTLANLPKTSVWFDALIRAGVCCYLFLVVFRDTSSSPAGAPGGREALGRAGAENGADYKSVNFVTA